MKFQDNIWTTKVCPAMQYCNVITNLRWWTYAILKIVKSPYLGQKSSDFDEIWYTTSISETITTINMKFQDNIWTTKMCPAMQYCDVITNPRWDDRHFEDR